MSAVTIVDPLAATRTGRVDEPRGRAVHIVGPLAVLTVVAWTAVAMSPWLIQWPLVLIALNPRMLFLVMAAPKLGMWEFSLVATARLCIADPFSYALGLRYGGRVRARLERSRLRAAMMRLVRAERTACFIGVWLRPSQLMLAWAGSLRLSPRAVAVSDVVTTVVYVSIVYQGASLFL